MDEIDAQIAAIQNELTALRAQPVATTLPTAAPTIPATTAKGYLYRQGLFDVGAGAAKAAYGLADILTAPAIAGANLFGAELPYFGMSKMGEQDINRLAAALNVQPNTVGQEVVSFLAPSPLSKAKVASQAGTGLLSFLGYKGVEAVAPESEGAKLAGALLGPIAATGISKAGTKIKGVGQKLKVVPPTIEEQTASVVKAVDDEIAKLSTQAVEEPSRSITTAGMQQVNNIIEAKKDLKAAVTKAFTEPEVYNANVPTTGLRNDIDTIIADWAGGRKTQVGDESLSSSIQALRKLEKPKLGQALSAFTTQTPSEVPLGELHKLQIKIGQSLPRSGAETFTPDEALAGRLYEYIGNLIDNTPGSEKLMEAKRLSKSFRDAFVWNPTLRTRAPLATAQRRENEKVIPFLTGGSSRVDALQKAGVDITPLQNQLVNEFNAIKTPEKKVEWINKNRPTLEGAPFWNTFENVGQQLQTQLGQIQPLTQQSSALQQALGQIALRKLSSVPSLGVVPLALALGRRYGQQGVGTAFEFAGQNLERLPATDIGQTLARSGVALTPEQAVVQAAQQQQAIEPTVDIDAEIETVRQELEALRSAQTQPIKQGISLPTGDKYAPTNLMQAVINVESRGKSNAVSNKGARGPAQLMPKTAKELGVDINDPQQNVEGGSRYLRRMMNQFNDTKLALAAYNWGPGSVRKALNKLEQKKKAPTWENIVRYVSVPEETQQYVNKVLKQVQTLKVKQEQPEEESLLRTIASFAPVTGQVISAQDTIESLQQRDYGNALINALGVIPAVKLFAKAGKFGKAISKVDDISKLNETERLVERVAQAGRRIDIETATSRLQSLQQLQDTFQNLVTKGQGRAQRYFNKIGKGFNVDKQKQLLKETTDQLAKDKTKLEQINNEIALVKNNLQSAIGLKQVK